MVVGAGGFADDPGGYTPTSWGDGNDDDDDDNVRDSEDADEYLNDPRRDPSNWDSDSGDPSEVEGGGFVPPDDDDDDDDSNVRDSEDADEYLNDPRQDPRNWESDSGDASDVVGGGRVRPEDDEWAQEAQERAAEREAEEQADSGLANVPTDEVVDRFSGGDGSTEMDTAEGVPVGLAIAVVVAAGGAYLYMSDS